jgi:hypothetical protein
MATVTAKCFFVEPTKIPKSRTGKNITSKFHPRLRSFFFETFRFVSFCFVKFYFGVHCSQGFFADRFRHCDSHICTRVDRLRKQNVRRFFLVNLRRLNNRSVFRFRCGSTLKYQCALQPWKWLSDSISICLMFF